MDSVLNQTDVELGLCFMRKFVWRDALKVQLQIKAFAKEYANRTHTIGINVAIQVAPLALKLNRLVSTNALSDSLKKIISVSLTLKNARLLNTLISQKEDVILVNLLARNAKGLQINV